MNPSQRYRVAEYHKGDQIHVGRHELCPCSRTLHVSSTQPITYATRLGLGGGGGLSNDSSSVQKRSGGGGVVTRLNGSMQVTQCEERVSILFLVRRAGAPLEPKPHSLAKDRLILDFSARRAPDQPCITCARQGRTASVSDYGPDSALGPNSTTYGTPKMTGLADWLGCG